LSSKLNNLRVHSRKELRGVDPQSAMLDDVAKSDIAVSISIPEVFGDLAASELSILNQMVGCLLLPSDRPATEKTEGKDLTTPNRISVSIACDYVSLAVHGEIEATEGDLVISSASNSFSFMARMEQLTFHTLTEASSVRHIRILSHEFDFFESKSSPFTSSPPS